MRNTEPACRKGVEAHKANVVMTNSVRDDVFLLHNTCTLNGKQIAIKRSTAMNTVIQDEARSMANKKNTLSRHCNNDGPLRIVPKIPLCFCMITNKYRLSVIANANSKFMMTKFLREPNNTTMIIRLFAKIPPVQIVTVKIVEPGNRNFVLLYFITSEPFIEKNEVSIISLSIFMLSATPIKVLSKRVSFLQ